MIMGAFKQAGIISVDSYQELVGVLKAMAWQPPANGNRVSGLSRIAKRHGHNIADMIWDIQWRGNDIIYERVKKYGIECDLKPGFVQVATKQRQLADIDEYVEERVRHKHPFKYEAWDREQTRDNLGTDAFLGAFACYRDGHLHPLNLCIGEAKAAHELGVKIFEQSPVVGIDHGARPRVKTMHGYIEADSVVLAGNAYSQFEPKLLANLVFPAGTYIIATEPLSKEIAYSINKEDAAICDLNEIVNYFRLSADRRLLYGGACNYSGRDPASIKAFIEPRMLKTYPQLKGTKIEFEWGGKIGIVLNRIPAVGRIDNNIYFCQGYSGHGVSASHMMGEVMADAIGGTMEHFDLFANEEHFRIPGSQWMGNQIIALGMLYYRLKDML